MLTLIVLYNSEWLDSNNRLTKHMQLTWYLRTCLEVIGDIDRILACTMLKWFIFVPVFILYKYIVRYIHHMEAIEHKQLSK